MSPFYRNEHDVEVKSLIASGIATNEQHAERILKETSKRRERADLYIFYTNRHVVKTCLATRPVDERPYNGSNVRVATIPSGSMSRIGKLTGLTSSLAIGALKELVPKAELAQEATGQGIKLVAFVRNFQIDGKLGVFLSSTSAEAIHAQGRKTLDEKENLLRVEFSPIGGDFVLGMFSAWSRQPFGDSVSLVLWMPRSQTIAL